MPFFFSAYKHHQHHRKTDDINKGEMTNLELINKLFLQWFFVRIEKCHREKIVLDYTLEVTKDGSFSTLKSKEALATKKSEVWYSIRGWVLPFTEMEETPHHSKKSLKGRWHVRITGIREYFRKVENEEEWLDYLEKLQFDYCGEPHKHCEPFREMDVEMIISHGKIIDEA